MNPVRFFIFLFFYLIFFFFFASARFLSFSFLLFRFVLSSCRIVLACVLDVDVGWTHLYIDRRVLLARPEMQRKRSLVIS